MPEVRLKYDDLGGPQEITAKVGKALADLMGQRDAIHRWDVETLEDDDDRKERVLKVQPKRTYVVLGGT